MNIMKNARVRHANMKDISQIAEIIVFGKRVAYRPIFQNEEVSFNELQVLDIIEMYQKKSSSFRKYIGL